MPTSSGYTLVTDTHDGSDGAQGADGQFERTVYQNVENQPAFPIDGDESTAPTGWTFVPEASETQRFKSVATFPDTNTTLTAEVSEITFSGTTAQLTEIPAETEVTEIGISGSTSGIAPDAATAEISQIEFFGTSANTSGGPDTFSKTSSGISFQQIRFGGGTWVGVGANSGGKGGIWVSTTAAGTFTQATTTPNTTFLNDVAYDGSGRWIAVGNKTGGATQIWTATDPTGTWTNVGGLTDIDTTGDGDESMNGVTHDGTQWLVVGADATILIAVDPTLDHTDTSGDGWVTVARKTDLGITNGRSLRKIAYDGTTNYVAVGDDRNNSEQLFTATDPTGISPGTTGGWAVNNTHGFTTDINNAAFANGVWVMCTDFDNISFNSNVIVVTDPTSTTASDWVTTASGTGSAMNDAAFHNGKWYAVTDATNDTSYMESTDNGVTWSTGNVTTGFVTSRLRAAESGDGDLVFATQDGIIEVIQASAIGSMFTIDGDNRNFPSGSVSIEFTSAIGGGAMRDEAIIGINSSTNITGLTAATGTGSERVSITAADAGTRSNIVSDITNPSGDASTTTLVLTEGRDIDNVDNQQLGILFTGTSVSGTTVTMDGDSREFTSGSFTVTFPVGSDADTMVSLTAASLEANTTGLNITPVGPRLQVDTIAAGARTTTDITASGGGLSFTTTSQAGSDGDGTTESTYSLTSDSTNHIPTSMITGSFDAGTNAATAIEVIRQRFLNGDIDGYTSISAVQTKTVGSDTVHYFEATTTTSGEDVDLAFGIVDGTGGNLDPDLLVTNQGSTGVSDGVQDAWTTVINQATYTGTFGSQADGDAQASQQATQLTALVVADPIFTAVQDTTNTSLLRITARDNGNQYDTTASVTRGSSNLGAASTANRTPPVVTTDGIANPNWSQPVQDGFRGTTGVDGARGPGRFNGSVTLTNNTVHAVGSTKFNDDALAAIVTALGAGSGPAEGDVATIIYTQLNGTVYSLTGLHDGTGTDPDDWTGFALEIDGNLLVDGTIVGDKLIAGTVTATQVNLFPQDVGAGVANTGSASRMVITGDKIEIYEGTTLRVVLGDLT